MSDELRQMIDRQSANVLRLIERQQALLLEIRELRARLQKEASNYEAQYDRNRRAMVALVRHAGGEVRLPDLADTVDVDGYSWVERIYAPGQGLIYRVCSNKTEPKAHA